MTDVTPQHIRRGPAIPWADVLRRRGPRLGRPQSDRCRGCRRGRDALEAALADKKAFAGAAGDQVDDVVAMVDALVSRYPDAAKYTPGAIL